MQLKSDYTEAYDCLLSNSGRIFERMAFTKGGLSKNETFSFFQKLDIPTPINGFVSEIKAKLSQYYSTEALLKAAHFKVVLYHDEFAHCGEGKELVALADAPNHIYASLYYPPSILGACTIRQIRFGPIEYWRSNTSKDWRSNIECTRKVIKRSLNLPIDKRISRILWAIDYLPTSQGLLAIDFNTAPSFELINEEFPDDKYLYPNILEACPDRWLSQF